MRINNDVPLTPITDTGKRLERTEAGTRSPTDQIQLSTAASIASTARSQAAATQSEKIAALRLQVANGSYRIGSEDIANSMLDEMMGGGS